MEVLDVAVAKASRRRATLVAWIAEQPDGRSAGATLVRELEALLDDDELAQLLDADDLWTPLANLAEASDGRTASTLWAWASVAANVRGALADHASDFALRAVREDPSHEVAWRAFEACVTGDRVEPTIWEALDEWCGAASGRATFAVRAIRALDRGAQGWIDPRDNDRLREAKRRAAA